MCGIIGIARQKKNTVLDIYDGLLMLQHRGQDAAGIVTYDGNHFYEKRGKGLVRDIFQKRHISKLEGRFGIGHVRYPTAGTASALETQPFFVNSPFGIYLIHNGNLTNTSEKRKKIKEKYNRHLRTESDTEILLNCLADKIYETIKNNKKEINLDYSKIILEAVSKLMKGIKGAYSVICMIDKVGLLAFRDPYGIRPLSFGQKEGTNGADIAFASEDVAFKSIGFKKIRDVKPGEAILVPLEGEIIKHQCAEGILNPCLFEYIYLARPDSMLDKISVYKTQLRLGQSLAKQIKDSKIHIDTVMPVPDSSRPSALELSKELGIKYREGLVKNRYVGRTFIMPNQAMRAKSVKRKLNTIPLEFKGKDILLVDDSIVRGTTMKSIVQLCREAGSNKVYVASAAPPVRYPNVYGVDMPTRKELIADGLSIEQIEKSLGIDKLFYQTIEDAIGAAKTGNPSIKNFDCSCFDGKYVTGDIDETYLETLEHSSRVLQRNLPLISL